MNGNTVFIDEGPVDAQASFYQLDPRTNLWIIEDEDGEYTVAAPDFIGEKVYGIMVDDVSLIYDATRGYLVWSITWSTIDNLG